LKVVVQDGRNYRYHVRLDNSSSYSFRSSHSNVDYALEGQVPFPHLHHVFTPALLEDAYQPLDAAIDGEYVPYSTG
jgi:hypothetical protein